MLVYRKNPKTGFTEVINTDGNYKPKSWKVLHKTKKTCR